MRLESEHATHQAGIGQQIPHKPTLPHGGWGTGLTGMIFCKFDRLGALALRLLDRLLEQRDADAFVAVAQAHGPGLDLAAPGLLALLAALARDPVNYDGADDLVAELGDDDVGVVAPGPVDVLGGEQVVLGEPAGRGQQRHEHARHGRQDDRPVVVPLAHDLREDRHERQGGRSVDAVEDERLVGGLAHLCDAVGRELDRRDLLILVLGQVGLELGDAGQGVGLGGRDLAVVLHGRVGGGRKWEAKNAVPNRCQQRDFGGRGKPRDAHARSGRNG
nr:hypothetical protein CFP56_12322 [Quercus suber]